MQNYHIEVSFLLPAPHRRMTTVRANRISVAVRRAIEKLRTEFNGRRIGEIWVKAKRL